MKRFILLIALYPFCVSAQLKKDYVDSYTKEKVKETSRIILQSKMSKTLSFVCGDKDGYKYLDAYIALYDIFTIHKGDDLYFYLTTIVH